MGEKLAVPGSNFPQSTHASAVTFSPFVLREIALTLDLVLLAIAGCFSVVLTHGPSGGVGRVDVFALMFIATTYLILGLHGRIFDVRSVLRPYMTADVVLIALVTAFAFLLSVLLCLERFQDIGATRLAHALLLSFVAIFSGRIALSKVVERLARRGVVGRRAAVFGVGEQRDRLLRHIEETKPLFVSVIGVFAPSCEHDATAVDGDIEALMRRVRCGDVDDVVVAMPWNASGEIVETVRRLRELPVNVHLASDLAGFDLLVRPMLGFDADMPLFEVQKRPISGWSHAIKTLSDYVMATTILLLISPLMLAIAALIKLDSRGPVFFMQERLGFNNQVFLIFKFRSMRHNCDLGPVVKQATKRDPRVTRIGRIIRATSLDELPQLLNVLNGTMSLVGPRPHALSHNEEYGQLIRGYFARHRVKPGITGWAQVNGLRGETETVEKMEDRIRYDIYYADNWSFFFDMRILVLTAVVVLFQRSAY